MDEAIPKNSRARKHMYDTCTWNTGCRITRIPNIRFTCFPAFRRLAAVAVSFRSFVFHSTSRRESEIEHGRFVYLNCRCQWKNAASTLRTDHTNTLSYTRLAHDITYVYVYRNVEKRDTHRCSLRLTSDRTTNANQENVEPRLIAAWKSSQTHCRDVLLVFHLPVTLSPSASLSLARSTFRFFCLLFGTVLILSLDALWNE